MKSDVLSLTDFTFLAEISTVIFMTVFFGALYWIFRPGAKAAYTAMSLMPLDDQNPIESVD